MDTSPAITDKRLLRGSRTRQAVLHRAVDVASMEGLGGLSFGRLAADTGMSKAGVQTLFKTKEALQLAAVDHARGMFIDAVIKPAESAPAGVDRLRALVESWIVYATTPLFPGGCFRVANMADFDSRPGAVQDALVRDQQVWLKVLAEQVRAAVAAGQIPAVDVDLVIFQLDAVLCAANTALRLGHEGAVDAIRRTLEMLISPA